MIHIFEPHGDDALISCYPILRKSASTTNIITVGQSRSSEGLGRHFPGIRTQYEGIYEIPNQTGRAAYMRDYRSWQKHAVVQDPRSPWQWQRDVTEEHNGELWKESYQLTWDFVEDYLAKLYNTNLHGSPHLVLAPVGLLHPYHIVLADVLWHCLANFPFIQFGFYSEAPYNAGKWVREIEYAHPVVDQLTKNGKLGSISYPATDPAVKEKIFRDVYPSEVAIFRYTRDEVLSNACRLYLPINWTHIL